MGKKKNKGSRKRKGEALENEGGAPARIAGVAVPRPLRNAGAQLRELAKDPVVSDLIASGLIAAAAALSQTGAARKAKSKAANAAADVMDETAEAGAQVKQRLIDLARDVLDAVEAAGRPGNRQS